MNYPKTIKKYIKGVGQVEIRPYLTTNEINAILDTIQENTTAYATRKMMLYSMVMRSCTNIEDFDSEEVSVELVETYAYNGVFDRITKFIKGYDTLVEGFEKMPISDVYKRFEGVLEEFTEQFKNINLDESMKKFETELGKLKEVEKEKEAILNGK